MTRALQFALALAFILALFSVASIANGQEPTADPSSAGAPEIDVPAVLRMGDHVQHVDGINCGPDDAFCQAMAVPADDIDKWFICILTTNKCPACDSLKATWNSTPELSALGNLDAAKSWSHFAEWNMADESKAYKFRDVRTSSYPTVVVKPPKSGIHGPAHEIVYQHVGAGLPGKELARQIREAIKLRVAKYPGPAVVTPLDAPLKLGTSPPPAESPSGIAQPSAVQDIGGSHRFPDLPFDPDGTEGRLKLFPKNQVPEVPPTELLGGGLLSRWLGFDQIANTLWSIVWALLGLACVLLTGVGLLVAMIVTAWKFFTVALPWMIGGWGARAATNAARGAVQAWAEAPAEGRATTVGGGSVAVASQSDMASIIAAAVQTGVVEALRVTKTSVAPRSRSRSTAKKS